MKRILLLLISVSLIVSMLFGCSPSTPTQGDIESPTQGGIAGKYSGSATAYHGELNVEVTLDEGGKITLIEVDENHGETPNIGTLPIEKFPAEIVSTQSLNVDSITGATITGDAIIAAIADALICWIKSC